MIKFRLLLSVFSAALFALILLLVAFWNSEIAGRRFEVTQLLYPEFSNKISAIKKLEIYEAATEKITLKKLQDKQGNKYWVWADKHNYPIKPERLIKFFNQIANFQSEVELTKLKHRYVALGVQDLPKNNKNFQEFPRRIAISGEGKIFVDLIIGKQKQTYSNYEIYLRKNKDKQAWKTSSIKPLSLDYLDLIDHIILDVPKSEIQKIAFSADEKELYTFASQKNTEDYILSPIPKGQEIKSQFINNSFSGLFERLRFVDVRPLTKDLELGNPLRMIKIYRHEKLNYKIIVYYIEEVGMWFTLSAYSQEAKLTEAVDKFNKKHKNWLYKGSNWLQNKMLTKKDELFKKKTKKSLEKPSAKTN